MESRQTKFYYDNSDNGQMDVVDQYLLDRFGIVLNSNTQDEQDSMEIESDSPDKRKRKKSGFKFTQHTSKESEAKILDNPVYQKMQFYPFRNQLIWQEKEEQQKLDTLDNWQKDEYNKIMNDYKSMLTDQVQLYLKHNPEA